MKKVLFLITIYISVSAWSSNAQVGEWVWLHGSSGPYSNGNHGVKGMPGPSNEPPAMYEPCEWKDNNGNFWIYGGLSAGINLYSDLWKFDPVQNEWTWVSGPNSLNDPGSYGTQGISSPTNRPPARGYGAASWVDKNGNLWLFGGDKVSGGALNDLWKYDVSSNEWTWMKGPNISNQPDVYGTKGVPDSANTPGSRWECATAWTDTAGDLWLFGGLSYGGYSDMWRFNIATNNWTWMSGPSLTNQTGFYGVKGVENSANVPSYRAAHCRWIDNRGNLWLYGGENGYNFNCYNDLWKFNVTTNNWTWMSGDSTVNGSGIYGTKCALSGSAQPGTRMENRSAWTDANGNLWMFGGSLDGFGHNQMNDLWMYCVTSNQWTWMGGDSTANMPGSWGTLGVSNASNKPSGRGGSVGWTDAGGNLYMFGGTAMVTNSFTPYNDLWKYTIDPCCSACNPVAAVADFVTTDSVLCLGECTNFTNLSSNANTWTWSFPGGSPSSASGLNAPSVCYYASGNYDITLIVSNCNTIDTLTKSTYIHVYPSPPTPNITQSHDTLFASTDPSYVSYQWYFNSTPVPGATDTFFVAMLTGNYNLKVVDVNGCSIAVGISIVGLNETVNPKGIVISPNPAENAIAISGDFISKNNSVDIEIDNSLGQVIRQEKKLAGVNVIYMDVEGLAAGIYYVRITSSRERWITRFAKQ